MPPPAFGDNANEVVCMLTTMREQLYEEAGPRLMRAFASLLDDTETMLVLFHRDGFVESCAGCLSPVSAIQELFDAETIADLEQLIAQQALSEPAEVDGSATDGTRLAIRLMESPFQPGVLLAFVRTARTAGEDELLSRVRALRATLQEVADLALRSQEIRAADSRRRRAEILGLLTERERLVASAIADGRRSAQIAESLFVSESTVRNYLSSIYRKLGIQSQSGLIELLRPGD